jgi:hypothetical protein
MHREHLSWHALANGGRMPLSSGRRLSPQLLPRQSALARSRIHVDATIRVPGRQFGAADLLISPRSSWQARHAL